MENNSEKNGKKMWTGTGLFILKVLYLLQMNGCWSTNMEMISISFLSTNYQVKIQIRDTEGQEMCHPLNRKSIRLQMLLNHLIYKFELAALPNTFFAIFWMVQGFIGIILKGLLEILKNQNSNNEQAYIQSFKTMLALLG